MTKSKNKANNGIILIALVITIIVLLILAGVTIATLTGDNGVLTKATQAKEQTIRGQEKEAISLAYTACKSNDYTKDVESEDMQKELEKNQNNVQVSSILKKLNILFKDTKHRYTVDQDGNIEQILDLTPEEAEKIVDMLNANIGITAGGKVIYIETGKVESKYAMLDTTNRITITEEGIKGLGENYLIDNVGKIYTWGENYRGQLGSGTTESSSIPVCISDLENDLKGKKIVDIINCNETMVALDEEGKVYTWGDNYSGKLGDGTTEVGYGKFRAIPMCISDLENNLKGKKIVEINGRNAIIARDEEGKVYTWGDNYSGKLGNGTTESSSIPVCISELENDLKGKKIADIINCNETMVALDEEGKVYTWGDNYSGQLGDGTTEVGYGKFRAIPMCISDLENNLKGKKIVEINGHNTIIARDEEGKIYTWGENNRGQLGNGTMEDSEIPVCISELENDLKGKKIVEINNDSTMIARDETGKVYTWGENNRGQLGNGTMEDSEIPVCISELENDLKGKKIVEINNDSTMIARDEAGKVYTWGRNYYGELGNGTMKDSEIPVCISELENDLKGKKIVDIINYNETMVALDEEGKVYAWGRNDCGQVGDGTPEDGNVPTCLNDDENSILHNKVVNKIKDFSLQGRGIIYCNYITDDGEIIYFLYYVPI